jgi:desulfoferrodoxin (superoxide reductase-like protein)
MNDKKHIPACIDQMTSQQAKIELGYGRFGEPGTPSHNFASFWISLKEQEERDKRDNDSLSISRKALRNSNWANIIAAIATIIAIAAIIVPLLIKK